MTRQTSSGIFRESLRRRVFQVAAIYIAGAFVALQVADLAFPGLSIPDAALKYIWVGAMLGFPFALFFGWRFELVDGRILRTAAADGAPALPISKGDKLVLSVASILLAAIGVGMALEISKLRVAEPARPKLAAATPNSVAVLPFSNFGGVPENEYLADGLTETLLHALAQARGLMVTARTSSFYYKGKDIDVRDIAAELGVSKILEGSVQQSGDRIRIVAQLIEADSGFHLWSNTYDRDLGDIFAIQDSIASDVAIAILATVTAAPGLSDLQLTAVSTTNFDAYQKYLEGLEQARISSNVSLPKAEVLLQQALAIDADFFEARKELAFTTITMFDNGTIMRQAALDRGAPLVDRLLEERPGDGMVIAMHARIRSLADPTSVDDEELVTRLAAAIEREPNETRVYSYLASSLRRLGRPDESIEWLNRAIIIDPLDFRLHYDLAGRLLSLGNLQASLEAYERVTETNPQWATGYARKGWAKYWLGDYVGWYQGMTYAAILDPLDPDFETGLTQGLMGLGMYEEARHHVAAANDINAARGGEIHYSSLLSLLDEPSRSRALTESFLRVEPPERSAGYLWPAIVYACTSIDTGKAQEALAVFEELFPGVTTVDFEPASDNDFHVQFGATIVWAHDKETSEVSARLDALTHPYWKVGSWAVTAAEMRGNIEEASRLAIAALERETFWMLFGYRNLCQARSLMKEPAVAARLAEMEEAVRPGRAALRAYIAEQENEG